MFDEFADAFDKADVLVLTDIYAAREKDIYNVSSEALAQKIKENHPDKEIYYIEELGDIASKVWDEAEEGDLVITMGAGDIYKAGQMML